MEKKDNRDRHDRPSHPGLRFSEKRCFYNNQQQSSSSGRNTKYSQSAKHACFRRKIKNWGITSSTLVKPVTDPDRSRPIHTKHLKSDKDMSTQTRINSHVDHKMAQFLFPPMENPNETIDFTTYFAFGDMLPLRTLFHAYNNRNGNSRKADKQMPRTLRSPFADHAHNHMLSRYRIRTQTC